MDNNRYPARLANATFYDTEKITVRNDPEHSCVEIILSGKDHWGSTRILAFGHGDAIPEVVMLEDLADADASETDA